MDNEQARETIFKWRDELYQTRHGIDVIRAIQERIAKEADQEHLKQLNFMLAEECERQGFREAARAARRRNVSAELGHWYDELKRTSQGAEIVTAIEERIKSETDATKRQELGFTLAYEYNEREDYGASEALYLRLFEAEPDDPFPLIQLAEQKLYRETQAEGAMQVIDRAIEAAYHSGNLRRNALTVKARIALWKKDYQVIEGVLRQLMQLGFDRGNSDTWIKRDFFDRLPPGSIDPDLARQYDEHCREGDCY
jgi:hypothetical protein